MATTETTGTTETTTQTSEALYQAVLNRMNITWEPDAKTAENIKNAIEEAQDYLHSAAGSPGLSFDSGTNRTLLITCAWYITESKLADFRADYSEELTGLRLMEGFNCGKEESTV